MGEVEFYKQGQEEERIEVGEAVIQQRGLNEGEQSQRIRAVRMNKRWEEEGLQCPLAFPLPYVFLEKEKNNRKKEYRQAFREVKVNLMILGINKLWAGNQVEQHSRRAIHWDCASERLKEIYRVILRWENKTSNLPMCRAAFEYLTKEIKFTYGLQTESRMVETRLVEAERVALPKVTYKILQMLELLPLELREVYDQGEKIVSNNKEDWKKTRKIKIALRMPRQEYIKILTIMFKLGMVEFRKHAEISMINGLQCVRKDENKLRLIFDGRPVNCILQDPPKAVLPGFHLLESWNLTEKEISLFGKIDLDNYYHRIGVPEWLKCLLGLPPVSELEVSIISEGKEKRNNVGMVCATLPMGLSHAVFIAQEIHMNLLRRVRPELPLNQYVQMTDRMWVLVYIDDVLIGARAEQKEEGARIVNETIARICQEYASVGLKVNKENLRWANDHMIGLGCEFNGKEGSIRPSEVRFKQLLPATKYMLSLEWISKKSLEIILGHWVWLLLLRRQFFSILFNIYRMLQDMPEAQNKKLWTSVKDEFRMMTWLLGAIKLTWSRGRSGWAVATDASLKGAGACEAWMDKSWWRSLIWEDGGFKNVSEMVAWANWTKIFQYKWGYQEHINVLEARALVMCLSNIIQQKERIRDIWLCAVDSMVVLGAVKKERSSSYMLNNQLRRILVLCLIADAAVYIAWISTDDNPADLLSRVFV